jgi:hypothetical protein
MPPAKGRSSGLEDCSSTNNCLFTNVGWQGSRDAIEATTSVNSVNTVYNPTYTATEAELRICRVGATVYTYHRTIGTTTWTLHFTFARGDFPNTLHVGIEHDAMPQPPDLLATFDDVRFGNVATLADCTVDP